MDIFSDLEMSPISIKAMDILICMRSLASDVLIPLEMFMYFHFVPFNSSPLTVIMVEKQRNAFCSSQSVPSCDATI